jgi:pyruvate dehydrogenase E1 component
VHRKVWCFCGDGEMDEPESMGALDIAHREQLDNLVFVVNCNLQRLDGPVRGNGKIIQELEGTFRGAGWNVIKLVWGGPWDALLARDPSGRLIQAMNETVDGEYQSYKARGGAFTREHFFGKYAETARLVETLSDDEIAALPRGGHDPHKVYAAYAAASKHTGSPTVILAKTVKGYGMGEAGEGQNITHQQKKIGLDALRKFRDRFKIPVPDDQLEAMPFYKPAEDAPEMQYLKARRAELGGSLPARVVKKEVLEIPPLTTFQRLLDGTGEREISTTMSFVQLLQTLDPRQEHRQSRGADHSGRSAHLRHGRHVPPARHLFDRRPEVQARRRRPARVLQGRHQGPDPGRRHHRKRRDVELHRGRYGLREPCFQPAAVLRVLFYVRLPARDGSVLGCRRHACARLPARRNRGPHHHQRRRPAARRRSHSLVMAGLVPNCKSYDPAFGYELAVIVHQGLREMYVEQQDHYYYVTIYNENHTHPAMPAGVESGIIKGLYLFKAEDKPSQEPMCS